MALQNKGNLVSPLSHDVSNVSDASGKMVKLQGVRFILRHFHAEGNALWPRTVSTYATGGAQLPVYSEGRALELFEESDWIDARINAFPYLEGIENKWWKPQQVPNFLFIDLDKADFGNDDLLLQKALTATLKNIKKELGLGAQPSVVASGRGFHLLLPLDMPTALENLPELTRFHELPSSEFLRYLERRLSKGKADSNHRASLKSCMLRVPASHNYKCIVAGLAETEVRVVQEWNGARPRMPRQLMYDFRAYLVNERIKQMKATQRRHRHHSNQELPGRIAWIETLMQKPIADYRKNAIALIVAPYLVNVKKVQPDLAYQILLEWLERCNEVHTLDFHPRQRLKYAIKTAIERRMLPMRAATLKAKSPTLYKELIGSG